MKLHLYPLFLSCCFLFTAVTPQAQVRSTIAAGIMAPTSGQTVDTLVPLQVNIQSDYPSTVTSVVASVAGHSWNMNYFGGTYYTDTISLGWLPVDSTYTLTIVAKNSNGDSAVASEPIVLDPKPVVTIVTPVEMAVARPNLPIKARCAVNAGHCQLTVTLSGLPGVLGYTTVGTFVDSVSTSVDVSAYEGLSNLRVNVSGADQFGNTGKDARDFYVETSPYLTPVYTSTKRIWDLAGNNILVYDALGSADTPKIVNFTTGATTPINFYGQIANNGGSLSDQGALFEGNWVARQQLYDWNNGSLDSLGGFPDAFRVSGSSAGWNKGGHQYYRNLATKANTDLGTNITNDFGVTSGTLAYRKSTIGGGDSVFLYQGGAPQLIMASRSLSLGAPMSDGNNVVYLATDQWFDEKITRYDAATGTSSVLVDLGSSVGIPTASSLYRIANGYTAYLAPDASSVYQAWVRDAAGVTTQVTSFTPQSSVLETLAPNGQLAFYVRSGNGVRYIYDKTLGLTQVSSAVGKPFYQNSKWYVVIGNTVFQANLSVTPDKADSFSIHVIQDSTYKFSSNDFSSHYETSGSLTKVTIAKLPVHGSLKLNGTNVSVNQVIPSSSLSTLVYAPALHYWGKDSIVWTGSNGFTPSPANVTLLINVDTLAAGPPPTVPPMPQITGLSAAYCSNYGTPVNFSVANMPVAGTGTTVTATLDGAALTVAANGAMSMKPWLMTAGYHNVVVVFTNSIGGDTGRASFQIVQASVAKVSVAASVTTLTSKTQSSVLTATNVSGGGTTPLFTFAWDRTIQNVIQAASTSNTATIAGSTLVQGSNRIYVRMQTSDSCASKVIDVDSVDLILSDTTAPPPSNGPLPPAPKVIGLQAHYCGVLGTQSVTISNLPASPATWSATMDGVATMVTAGRVSFSPNALGAGTHILQVVFTNSAGGDTSNYSFQVDAVHEPLVALHSSSTTVDVTMSTVVLTATPTAGGATPTYVFAKDVAFTNIVQRQSTTNSVTVEVSTLTAGRNVFYVQMKTSDSCTTTQMAMDSVVVTLEEPGAASRMIDMDNPGQPIVAGPNPVNGQLSIYGLMSSKSYSISLMSEKGQAFAQRQVEGQTQTSLYVDTRQTGLYFLRVYDVTKGRVIGFVKVLVLAQK